MLEPGGSLKWHQQDNETIASNVPTYVGTWNAQKFIAQAGGNQGDSADAISLRYHTRSSLLFTGF
jgi:hypothetical protein